MGWITQGPHGQHPPRPRACPPSPGPARVRPWTPRGWRGGAVGAAAAAGPLRTYFLAFLAEPVVVVSSSGSAMQVTVRRSLSHVLFWGVKALTVYRDWSGGSPT